jgi:hypothetical protein
MILCGGAIIGRPFQVDKTPNTHCNLLRENYFYHYIQLFVNFIAFNVQFVQVHYNYVIVGYWDGL